jgi:hypothetical protein
MAKGGARPGAGRPAGSITRPQLRDYWTSEQVKEFFESLYSRQQTDARIAIWCAEQIAGKAPQPLTGPEGGPIQIEGVEITVRKKKK